MAIQLPGRDLRPAEALLLQGSLTPAEVVRSPETMAAASATSGGALHGVVRFGLVHSPESETRVQIDRRTRTKDLETNDQVLSTRPVEEAPNKVRTDSSPLDLRKDMKPDEFERTGMRPDPLATHRITVEFDDLVAGGIRV